MIISNCDLLIAAAHGLRPLTVSAARQYGCLGRLLVVADWRDGRHSLKEAA